MLRQVILTTLMLVAMALGGCRANDIESLASGTGAHSDNPVYVTELLLDGESFVLVPRVSAGGADSFPRASATTLIPIALPERFTITATWLEIISGRAYEAQATVSASEIVVESGIGYLAVLFLPGGRMVIGSDPIPRSRKTVTRDIAEACGKRRLDLDRDIRPEVSAIPNLKEALEFVKDPINAVPCGEGK